MSSPAIAICGFAAGASLAAALTVGLRRARLRRLAAIERRLAEPDLPTLDRQLEFDESPAASWLQRMRQGFVRLVRQSGMAWEPALVYRLILLLVVSAGGGLLVWFDNPLAGLAGAAVAALLPLAGLAAWRARRLEAFERQLPEALDLLARAVRAGASLEQALALVGKQLPNPLGTEIRHVSNQLEMGLAVPAALRGLVRRVPLLETRIFATAVAVHRQAGGNLPTTLERLAAVVRDRLNYRRQFRAATAGGRMAALLMGTVAGLISLYVLVWEPDYAADFLAEPMGWTMLATALTLQAIGLTWVFALLRADR